MGKHAAIVGGGIAGLTTALCLIRAGWRVSLFEQAARISEVGAGLQISPNGMKVLRALRLEAELSARSFAPKSIEMRMGRSGRRIFRIPLGDAAVERWGAPYLHVHRADLIDILLRALESAQQDAVFLNTSVLGCDATSVHLANGEHVSADLIVGADGLHSVVRGYVSEGAEPKFAGNAAWRMTVPAEMLGDLLPPPSACIWAGEGRHAVTYRLRGGDLVNFVGLVETQKSTSESWSETGSKADVMADFAGWDPVITRIVEVARSHYRWALYHRAPLPRWSNGNCVVVGDAAHPMLPTLAQGAVMGIEDAWVLSSLLADGVSPQDVGALLYQARIRRVSKVQAKAESNVRNFHHSGVVAQAAHYVPMWLAGRVAPGFVNGLQDWLYGYDVTQEFCV